LVEGVVNVVALGAVIVVVGMIVLVIEAHVPTAGILGLAGVLGAAAGIGLIVAGAGAPLIVSLVIASVLALAGVGTFKRMAHRIRAAHRRMIRTGPAALIGAVATVRTWDGDEGQVSAAGTLWGARMSYGCQDPAPAPGERVIIDELDGLTVTVHKPDASEVM
jgi:membrane-bound serine protease (ClpP class)